MKKSILILVFCLLTSLGFTQSTTVRGNQFTLTGKIIEEVSLPPYCGTVAFATVIEFEVIAFSDEAYKAKKIGVIFTCPEFYGKDFFVKGATYSIQLADQNQADFGWLIPNEAILKKYKLPVKLWVIEAQKLP